MTYKIPTPADLMRGSADHLASHGITYEELSSGPLGEALTRKEIEPLVNNQAAVDELVAQMRAEAERMERRAA